MPTIDCACEDLSLAEILSWEFGELVVEVRKFRNGARAGYAYRWQCQNCGRKHGRKLDPMRLPFGQRPATVMHARPLRQQARSPLKARSSTSSLQRRRSKKRSSRDFQAQRRRVLDRDDWTCQGCGETDPELLEVHHVSYPEVPEDDVPDSELQTVCGACNLAERNDRMSGGQGGRVGV